MKHLAALTLALLSPAPLLAQAAPPAPVTGDAAAGLVSRAAAGEVRLYADAKLDDRRASFRVMATNRGAAPVPFGPEAVTVTADGKPLALATRAALVGGSGADDGAGPRYTSQSHVNATLPVNGAGQTDTSNYNGGMGATTAGVPNDTIDRARHDGVDPAFAAQLDAVLLRSGPVAPGASRSGQLFTDRLKRKAKQLDVAVTFAGEVHRFRIDAPR